MDESKSPAKLGRPSQPRGTKPLSKEKTNKDGHTHTEETLTTTRRQGTLNAVKEEHNPGSSGPGKMRGRTSRLTRLSGRTNFGESGKGKAANSHQQQVTEAPDSPGSYSTDSSPSTYRETGSPVVSGMTDKDLGEQAGGVADFNLAQWCCFTICRAEIWPTGVSACGRRCRGDACGGRRFHNRATVGSATGRGASLQRLYPPTVKSKATSIIYGLHLALYFSSQCRDCCLHTLAFQALNVRPFFPLYLCSSPPSIQTTSIYASSVLCTSRTSKEHTSTSRRRDTRKTSWLGDFKALLH